MEHGGTDRLAQIVYLSHGGGPLPILGDPSHKGMNDFMQLLPSQLRRPDTVLVISAHWEENEATLQGALNPPMLYDYYGFPEEAYEITYPAPGNPELASRIAELLRSNAIPSRIDSQRGFDHGLFIPLKMMYPHADIRCLQISLLHSLDPSTHLALGKVLGKMLNENILVIGSGFSFHNLRAFSFDNTHRPDQRNDQFQNWLIEACTKPGSQEDLEQQLINWEKAPSARYCHPREEHLLPLYVCCGMAGKPAKVLFDDYIAGKRAVAFSW